MLRPAGAREECMRRYATTTEEAPMTTENRTWTETIQIEGGQLLDKVKELIHEGNVRQITIKQGDGRSSRSR